MKCCFKNCSKSSVFSINLNNEPFLFYCPNHFVSVVKSFGLSKSSAVSLIKSKDLEPFVVSRLLNDLVGEDIVLEE